MPTGTANRVDESTVSLKGSLTGTTVGGTVIEGIAGRMVHVSGKEELECCSASCDTEGCLSEVSVVRALAFATGRKIVLPFSTEDEITILLGR